MPRVGTIKDYPATGLMTGCGNLYFYRVGEAKSSDANYVFLSSGDGSNAWMNLGGRDVRLRAAKLSAHEGKQGRRFYYHVQGINIRVVIEPFKPEDAQAAADDSMFKMTITLRKGRAVRTIQAVGDADC